ncbi:MAG: DUF1570 domain-containing protein [Pirellulales bacterium]
MHRIRFGLICLLASTPLAGPAWGLDRVVLRRDQQQQRIDGIRVATTDEGGLLLLDRQGVLWAVEPDELLRHTEDTAPYKPLSRAEMETVLLGNLPAGFEVHTTAHYLVCHNTSRAYVRWTGALLERLYGAFINYWRKRGFRLHESRFPLVVVVFADRKAYRQYARPELGDATESIVGYYSLQTNRVTMYDLTGVQASRRAGAARNSTKEINRVLSRPAAEPLVATVIHEATHQIAFNCGLLVRYADTPLWLNEGLAIYFETPDLTSSSGWRGIGNVNRRRLTLFRKNLPQRTAGSLQRLIADDQAIRHVRTAASAYAEAWALNYFLIRKRPRQYVQYLKMLSKKQALDQDDPATRIAQFQQHFGADLRDLEKQFLRYMAKVR